MRWERRCEGGVKSVFIMLMIHAKAIVQKTKENGTRWEWHRARGHIVAYAQVRPRRRHVGSHWETIILFEYA